MRSLWRQTALLAATGAFSAICSVAARSSSTAQSQLVEALSDYAVVALPGSARLAFLGGRLISPDKDHEDDFLGFEAVPVLDTEDLSWSTKDVKTVPIPSPREGHVVVPLSNNEVLIHGGISRQGLPVSDNWLLNLSNWTFSPFEDLPFLPKLAWHSATRVSHNQVIFAYGLNVETGLSSDRVFTMSKDSKDSWKWSLVSGQVIPEIRAIPSTGYNSTLRHSAQKAARISPDTSTTPEAAFNPKLSEVREEASASSKESRAYATESQSRGHKGSSANSEASSATSRSNKDDLEQRNQAQHHRNQAIAGSIGGLAGAAALAGLGFLLYRRRLNSTSNFKVLKVTHTSSGATSQPPPVSQLQYAKRAPQRMLSVWSHPSEPTSTPPPPNIVAMARNVSSQNMSESSHTSYPYLQPISFGQGDSLGSSARTAPDPFGTLKTDSILSRSDTIKSTESNSWLGYLRGVVSLRSPDIDSSVEATVDSHSPAPTTSSFTPIIDSYTSSDGATVSSRSVKSPRIGTSDVTVTPRLGHHRQQSDIEESEMGYLSEKSPSLSQPQ